jgi:tetratricopeptide (TPR) repeat protein
MFNVRELEKKYKKYKLKIIIKRLMIIIPIILFSLFLIIFLLSDSIPISKQDDTLDNAELLEKEMQKSELIEEDVLDETEEITAEDTSSDNINIDGMEDEQQTNLIIIKQNINDDIQDILNRFENTNNPALSLIIAKKYYNSGDYEKAYDYSLITNDIDDSINDAWIIYAKSLVKLNKKYKAMDALNTYIEKSHSPEAQMLLNDIESGIFHE